MSHCIGNHQNVTEEHPAPDAEIGYLCHGCYARLRSSLLEMPAVATWLEVNIAAGKAAGAEKVGGTREDPIPLRLDVLDLIGPHSRREMSAAAGDDITCQAGGANMHAVMLSWAKFVAEESKYPWTDRNDLTGLVGWLAGHLSWIAEQSWVDDLIADVRKLTSSAHRIAPWRPEARQDDSPCSSCGVRSVVIYVGDGISRCERRMGGCGRSIHLSNYALDAELPKTRRAG